MRLWSLHPKYLDAKGLVALWRETLLAQNVLAGKTKGYKNHPQLNRFKDTKDPLKFIGTYLYEVYLEACVRGYKFDESKILKKLSIKSQIKVTDGQLEYEFLHLKNKLKIRDPEKLKIITIEKKIKCHPLFKTKVGRIESWEVVSTSK